jgi:hypothetical protein
MPLAGWWPGPAWNLQFFTNLRCSLSTSFALSRPTNGDEDLFPIVPLLPVAVSQCKKASQRIVHRSSIIEPTARRVSEVVSRVGGRCGLSILSFSFSKQETVCVQTAELGQSHLHWLLYVYQLPSHTALVKITREHWYMHHVCCRSSSVAINCGTQELAWRGSC